jgi:AcrR family transcriptional regulator
LRGRIVAAAWEQIAAEGAPALSLRAIARALEITAPAIYNYFPDRDALVTALIVAAFNSIADDLMAALALLPETDPAARLRGLGLAYRQWAVTYPERYQLIFGTPIAGYTAPLEITMLPAGRSLQILVDVLHAAHAAGQLRMMNFAAMTGKVETMLREWQAVRAAGAEIEVLYLALSIWTRVHGWVSLEIGHLFPPFIDQPGEIYERELNTVIAQFLEE